MRGRGTLGIGAVCLVVMLAACSGGPDSQSLGSAASGLRVDAPPGWRVQTGEPHDTITVYKSASRVTEADDCNSDAIRNIVSARIRSTPGTAGFTSSRKLRTVNSKSGYGVESGFGGQNCDEGNQQVEFAQNGRHVSVYITFGPAVDQAGRERLYAMLNDLHVSPPKDATSDDK